MIIIWVNTFLLFTYTEISVHVKTLRVITPEGSHVSVIIHYSLKGKGIIIVLTIFIFFFFFFGLERSSVVGLHHFPSTIVIYPLFIELILKSEFFSKFFRFFQVKAPEIFPGLLAIKVFIRSAHYYSCSEE